MKRRFAGLTDTGLVRAANQDAYYADPDGRFFIVADGMGGHAGGQEASQIATKNIQAYLNEHWNTHTSSNVLLEEAVERANRGILKDQNEHPERADMGTTVVVLMFRQGQSWCANVGDSRLYRLRESHLSQLTEDDTWVSQAIKGGEMTAEQAKVHPWRHVLSKCLGRQDLEKIAIYPLEVEAGDRLLLCSDGLTEEVPDESIRAVLQEHESLEETTAQLVERAKKAGGSDNITTVVVDHD